MSDGGTGGKVSVLVWDLWTRVFHLLLIASVTGSLVTAEIGPLSLHYACGLTTLGLILFRLLWGLFGSATSRFSHFVKGPRAMLGYLKGVLRRKPSHTLGHNPVGGAMVVLLLAMIGLQSATGLFMSDDILFEGPLYPYAPAWLQKVFSAWHDGPGNLIMVLIGIHLASSLFYFFWKRENLVRPMIGGHAHLPEAIALAAKRNGETMIASPFRALGCIALAAAPPLALHFLL